MTDHPRPILPVIFNLTVAPLIMAMTALAYGVDAAAAFAVPYTMFWPAFLANAGLQIEANSIQQQNRRRRLPRLAAEALFLPVVVALMLWLNPAVALFLQDVTGWIVGAAVAGGTNRMIDALSSAAVSRAPADV
jgi:hypothetical protein